MDAVPFYHRPWFWTVAGAALWAILYAWALSHAGPEPRAFVGLLDAILFLGVLGLMISGLAQFVLPVRTWKERRAAVGRLLLYLAGAHGPVVFIQHGQEVAGRRDRERSGPGVLLIDTCSAAVLRTATRFTRAVGPGIVFLEPGERVAEAIDVRRQVRRLPARLPDAVAAPATGPSSQALTRDGVPVSADLAVTFMLDPGHNLPPREGQSPNLPPFEIHPPSAERAVYGHAYGEHDDSPWTELPLRLVVDLWREEVKRYRLEDLLGSREQAVPALAGIRATLLARLTPTTPRPKESVAVSKLPVGRELQVLQSRGIRVMDITISNLLLPESVQRERLDDWLADWTGKVRSRLAEAQPAGLSSTASIEPEPRSELAVKLTTGLAQRLASQGAAPSLEDSLSLILAEALRLCPSPKSADDRTRLTARLERVSTSLRPDGQGNSPADVGESPR